MNFINNKKINPLKHGAFQAMLIATAFVCLILLLSFSEYSREKTQINIKVAAYNVQYGDKGSAKEIGKMLRSFGFHVVCMSEVPGGDWASQVGKEMDLEYVILGKYTTAGHDDKYKAILSKTPLYDITEVLMGDTLHTAVKAKTKIGGQEISLYSVHFPFGWRDQAHIDETTHKIQTFVEHLKTHRDNETAVVAGDFNFVPSKVDTMNMYHEMFKGIGYKLAGENVGMPYDSLRSMVGNKKRIGRVIDHIFYDPSKMNALQAEIIELEKPLSDHKPVWASFQLE